VVTGRVLNLVGLQHRFAFARDGNLASKFADAIVSARMLLGAPAPPPSDGDIGPWKLQRQAMLRAYSRSTGFISPSALSAPCQQPAV
jgi:hypothetical protein